MKMMVYSSFALTRAISYRAKNMYLVLLTYAQDQASCFPTINTLAETLQESDSTVKRALRELKEIGLIRVYRPNTALKSVNRYIIMPTEWVDYETTYSEDMYTLSEAEFEELKAKIIEFYESNGIEDLHPELTEEDTKVNKPKKSTSLDARYEELQAKLSKNPKYKYNASDCVVVFAKYLKDSKGQQCKITSTVNKQIMNDRLVGLNNADIDLFMKTYIDMYDSHFRSDKYPSVSISSLKHDWIFNKVLVRAEAIKSTTATTKQELQLSGVKFTL